MINRENSYRQLKFNNESGKISKASFQKKLFNALKQMNKLNQEYAQICK